MKRLHKKDQVLFDYFMGQKYQDDNRSEEGGYLIPPSFMMKQEKPGFYNAILRLLHIGGWEEVEFFEFISNRVNERAKYFSNMIIGVQKK